MNDQCRNCGNAVELGLDFCSSHCQAEFMYGWRENSGFSIVETYEFDTEDCHD